MLCILEKIMPLICYGITQNAKYGTKLKILLKDCSYFLGFSLEKPIALSIIFFGSCNKFEMAFAFECTRLLLSIMKWLF
jgi:hypothetical protein